MISENSLASTKQEIRGENLMTFVGFIERKKRFVLKQAEVSVHKICLHNLLLIFKALPIFYFCNIFCFYQPKTRSLFINLYSFSKRKNSAALKKNQHTGEPKYLGVCGYYHSYNEKNGNTILANLFLANNCYWQ